LPLHQHWRLIKVYHLATILLAKVMSRLAPGMQINNGLNRSDLCRVPEVVEKYNTDPWFIQKYPSAWDTK
jgi:alpha-beta hydrolase superfamily lysophospholipase